MTRQEKWTIGVRSASCAILLLLLAVCGYAGAREQTTATLSVPVTYETMDAAQVSGSTMEEIRAKLSGEREQELSLLQSVIDHPQSDEQTVQRALEQKTQIAQRMELEAQTQASLAYMGYEDAAVVCGAEAVTVFVPWQSAQSEQDRVRLIDAAASQTQAEPDAIKIILAKNE